MLFELRKEIWDYRLQREIEITSEYLRSVMNYQTDQASRENRTQNGN